jgi:hydrogenase maturation protease
MTSADTASVSTMGTTIVGVGNILFKDEGIGCHVARALKQIALPDTEVIDGGTSPGVLLPENTDKLIVVDAARAGGTPGEVYRFELDDIALGQQPILSLHQMTLVANLLLTRARRDIPKTVIIGVEPKEIGWGLELSPELRERTPHIVKMILVELNKVGREGEARC